MANQHSGGITFYKEGEYMFTYRGPSRGLEWCGIADEEYSPVRPVHMSMPGFEDAYNRAMNIFTSSYKPPVEE